MGEALRKIGPNRGPYRNEAEALDAVVRRLVEALDPEAIWLFGSRGRNDNRESSDFDLLVVTKDADGESGADYARVDAPVLGMGIACDVVPCPKRVFERERGAKIGLVPRVVREGRVLYERR